MLAAAGVFGALSFFTARDDATQHVVGGPGSAYKGRSALLRGGNLVLERGPGISVAAARAFVRDHANPATPAFLQSGQALVVRRVSTPGVRVLAARSQLRAASLNDPAVGAFVDYWLGRGDG